MSSSTAFAFPSINRPIDYPEEWLVAAAETYDYSGIVSLSNCSGSLVRFDDSLPEDKAMVLTNGHCVKMIDPGVVLKDQAVSRSFTILGKTAKALGSIRADRLLFATMTKTDMALYRVRESYLDIEEDFGIVALTLARSAPVLDSEIEVLSGYWKRGYSCNVEAIVPKLQEGNWFFADSVRYSRPGCNVIGGTSGSPVVQAGTRTVVAVNNTINENGRRCLQNNPCEIAEDGTIFFAGPIAFVESYFSE